jgi:SAM-dependent methyltransferase
MTVESNVLRERLGRSPSSIEEELVSRLPMFDAAEQKTICNKAIKILGHRDVITDPRDFALVEKKDPELGRQLKSIGLKTHQDMLQVQFYNSAGGIFAMDKDYSFKAGYKHAAQGEMFGEQAVILEEYNYGSTVSYRSVLYQLLRHVDNLTGEESPSEIEKVARRAFSGKRVLELGCGPGFFLYTLRALGADVAGVDVSDKFREQTGQRQLNVSYGDARDLVGVVGEKRFDIVFSKDFLSFSVTQDDAEPVMKGVHSVLRPGGLTLHQIDYSRKDETAYFAMVEKIAPTALDRVKKKWLELEPEQKEMLLRPNVLNISLEHLERLGFRPLTRYRLDSEDWLTIVLRK